MERLAGGDNGQRRVVFDDREVGRKVLREHILRLPHGIVTVSLCVAFSVYWESFKFKKVEAIFIGEYL